MLLGFDNFLRWFLTFIFLFSCCILFSTLFIASSVTFWIHHNTLIVFILFLSFSSRAFLTGKEPFQIQLAQIMKYKHKIHKILSIRIKGRVVYRSHIEIWFASTCVGNLPQPDRWKFYWNFDINCRWMNSNQFQIFYVGNKYLTSIIYLVSDHDISMLVRDDNPDWWNTKPGNLQILIYAVECTSSTSFSQFHMKRVFILSEEAFNPQWTSKVTSMLLQKQMEKCQTDGKSLCDQDILFSAGLIGTLGINMKLNNLWFKPCLSIVIIENN